MIKLWPPMCQSFRKYKWITCRSHSIAVKVHSISAQERIILPETMVSPKYYNGQVIHLYFLKDWHIGGHNFIINFTPYIYTLIIQCTLLHMLSCYSIGWFHCLNVLISCSTWYYSVSILAAEVHGIIRALYSVLNSRKWTAL
jgi:hypothetical protein